MGVTAILAATYLIVGLLNIANNHHGGDAESTILRAKRETMDNENEPRIPEAYNRVALRDYNTNKLDNSETMKTFSGTIDNNDDSEAHNSEEHFNFNGDTNLNRDEIDTDTIARLESLLNEIPQNVHIKDDKDENTKPTSSQNQHKDDSNPNSDGIDSETTNSITKHYQDNKLSTVINEDNTQDVNAETTQYTNLNSDENDAATAKTNAHPSDFLSKLHRNKPYLHLPRRKRQLSDRNTYYVNPQVNSQAPRKTAQNSTGVFNSLYNYFHGAYRYVIPKSERIVQDPHNNENNEPNTNNETEDNDSDTHNGRNNRSTKEKKGDNYKPKDACFICVKSQCPVGQTRVGGKCVSEQDDYI